jgi:hypothetical protein
MSKNCNNKYININIRLKSVVIKIQDSGEDNETEYFISSSHLNIPGC